MKANELLERLKKDVDDVVISYTTEKTTHINYHNSKVSTTKVWDLSSMSVFVALKKKLLSISVSKIDDVERIANKIVSLVKQAEDNPEYEGLAQGPFEYKPLKENYDPDVEKLNCVELLAKALETARKNGAERCAGVVEKTISRDHLLTSNGVEAEEPATQLYFSCRAFAESSGHGVCVSRNLEGFQYEEAAKRAALTANAKNLVTIEPGKHDIIFSPLAMANFLQHLGSAASIFNVEARMSCLKDKLNKKVCSLTIWNDGNPSNGYEARAFDDEGTPTKKTLLFDKGVFKTYLHNTSSAKTYNVENTATAGIIAPSTQHLIIAPGEKTEAQLFEGFTGLYITNVWYTRFQNYETGDFSTIPRDAIYVFKDGKSAGYTKDIRISDNLLRIMENVITLGNNTVQIKGWEVETPVFTPSAIVKDVNITKSVE